MGHFTIFRLMVAQISKTNISRIIMKLSMLLIAEDDVGDENYEYEMIVDDTGEDNKYGSIII